MFQLSAMFNYWQKTIGRYSTITDIQFNQLHARLGNLERKKIINLKYVLRMMLNSCVLGMTLNSSVVCLTLEYLSTYCVPVACLPG